jgi:very-short-patch-repair endonuclease
MARFHLPPAEIEVIVGPDGEYRLDFAYVGIKFSIEVDGYIWHITPEHQQRDHIRRNKLETDGWHNLVYTYLDVTGRPEHVAAEIMQMYRRLVAA